MKRYILKRILLGIGILFSISLITFFILNIIPGDPVALMLGDAATPETIATVRHNLGMDKPLIQQYLDWIAGLLSGDLGESYFQHKPVIDLLPCIALGLRYAASISRITRTSMLEVMNQDYIRTARAKGLSSGRTVLVHMLRNALVPIITVIGTDIGTLLAGSMLTESVFNIPGVGKLLVDNITKRDIPVVQGCVMYIAVVCVVVYLAVDILYAVIDPNIRLGGDQV